MSSCTSIHPFKSSNHYGILMPSKGSMDKVVGTSDALRCRSSFRTTVTSGCCGLASADSTVSTAAGPKKWPSFCAFLCHHLHQKCQAKELQELKAMILELSEPSEAAAARREVATVADALSMPSRPVWFKKHN